MKQTDIMEYRLCLLVLFTWKFSTPVFSTILLYKSCSHCPTFSNWYRYCFLFYFSIFFSGICVHVFKGIYDSV